MWVPYDSSSSVRILAARANEKCNQFRHNNFGVIESFVELLENRGVRPPRLVRSKIVITSDSVNGVEALGWSAPDVKRWHETH